MPKKRYNLGDFKERKAEEGFEIELDDGVVVEVPAQELWPDSAYTKIRNEDVVSAAQDILGDEVYATFQANGGNAAVLFAFYKENQGLDAGESTASSSS